MVIIYEDKREQKMLDLIKDLCDELADKEKCSQETFLKVAYVFENYRGFPDDAWPEDVKSINVDKYDFLLLKDCLQERISTETDVQLVATAIWAFGKAAEESDKGYLSTLLARYVDQDGNITYQVMCALGNIGIKIFENGGGSVLDVEVNRAAARKYLNLA